MNVTYDVSADTVVNATSIAKSRAQAEGWLMVNVVSTQSTGHRQYRINLIVSSRNNK